MEEQALASSTNQLAAQAALRQALLRQELSRKGLSPFLHYSASVTPAISGDATVTNVKPGFDVSLELDLFGTRKLLRDAGLLSTQTSAASLSAVRAAISRELALEYIKLRNFQARLKVANENLLSQIETLQIARRRLEAGLCGRTEVEKVRNATDQMRSNASSAHLGIEASIGALAMLAGGLSAALEQSLRLARPGPQAGIYAGMDQIPVGIQDQRADVMLAQLKVERVKARLAQMHAQRMPVISLGGTVGLNGITAAALPRTSAQLNAVGITIVFPVQDNDLLDLRIKAQEIALADAQASYQSIRSAVLPELDFALATLVSDHERLNRLNLASVATSLKTKLMRQLYSTGGTTFQRVLEVQHNQFETQDSAVGAEADVGADQVRLLQAQGGG